MKFLWLDNEGPVIYIGGKDADLKGREGVVKAFPFKKPETRLVTVDFSGDVREVPVERLVRKGPTRDCRVQKVSPDVTAILWEGFSNNANAYVVHGKDDRWLIVDPGHRQLAGSCLAALFGLGLFPDQAAAALFTHAHPDHFESADLFAGLGLPLGLSPEEQAYNQDMGRMLYHMCQSTLPDVGIALSLDEGKLDLDGFDISVVPTPGHTPGSVCLWLPEHGTLLTGDLVFDQGVGRTDFPGGDSPSLFRSIAAVERLDPVAVCPGHGPCVTGRDAVKRNFQVVKRFAAYM